MGASMRESLSVRAVSFSSLYILCWTACQVFGPRWPELPCQGMQAQNSEQLAAILGHMLVLQA
eukprot:scaffold326016_cov58-Tisochrysis_lutea.AAC.1